MYTLFALTDNPNHKIARFPLSHEIQAEATNYFKAQEVVFRQERSQDVPFDGKYKPDDDESLVINDFNLGLNLQEAIDAPLGIREIPSNSAAFSGIKALFMTYKNQNDLPVMLAQHFDKRRILSTRGFSIYHSADVYKKIDGIGVTIDSKLTAILEGTILRFSSFHAARQIFDLSKYYREATNSDILSFSETPSLKIGNLENFQLMSDTPIRRKIALIQESEILDRVPVAVLKVIALQFQLELQTENVDGSEVIIMPNSKSDVKDVLQFLAEDYYISPISQIPHITNSRRPMRRRGR